MGRLLSRGPKRALFFFCFATLGDSNWTINNCIRSSLSRRQSTQSILPGTLSRHSPVIHSALGMNPPGAELLMRGKTNKALIQLLLHISRSMFYDTPNSQMKMFVSPDVCVFFFVTSSYCSTPTIESLQRTIDTARHHRPPTITILFRSKSINQAQENFVFSSQAQA